ncbi:MAG: nuclear transport factor 2 family protein [Pseudomonadota bacterium]
MLNSLSNRRSGWRALSVIALLPALLLAQPALAQDEPSDGANVWKIVEEQWDAEGSGDRKWPERLLADSFSGWDKSAPAPRSKTSTEYWNRFSESLGKTVAHELYPLSIVVTGDTAIAHYLYTSAFERKDGEIEMDNGRFTDILIRTDEGWKFLAWHGGDD